MVLIVLFKVPQPSILMPFCWVMLSVNNWGVNGFCNFSFSHFYEKFDLNH